MSAWSGYIQLNPLGPEAKMIQDRTNTLIPNSENLFTVAARNDINILRRAPFGKSIFNLIRLFDVQEAAFRLPEDIAIICDSI